jgi:hypothetical protein
VSKDEKVFKLLRECGLKQGKLWQSVPKLEKVYGRLQKAFKVCQVLIKCAKYWVSVPSVEKKCHKMRKYKKV